MLHLCSIFLFAYRFLLSMLFGVYIFLILMIALIFVVVLVLLFPFFFPGYYITELMMSFLPYLIWIAGIFLLVSFVQLKKKMKPGYPHVTQRYFRGVSFLVFCGLFFVWSKQFNHFYTTESFTNEQTTWSLKVFFANIHKDNTHYEEIEKTISDLDPDILMFVEFADHHYDHFREFLQKKYPYTNNISWSKTFVWNMVFSKYPINNKADDFPQGARRYGYFSVLYQQQKLYFYLVHTSSPDNYDHFLMRNEQLKTFVQDFEKHESDRKHENIFVVGDFNITPWSSDYPILDSAFSGKLTNVTSRIPFLFTRKLKELPMFFAHIDHLRVTPSLTVSSLTPITIPWSDHKGFFTTLERK